MGKSQWLRDEGRDCRKQLVEPSPCRALRALPLSSGRFTSRCGRHEWLSRSRVVRAESRAALALHAAGKVWGGAGSSLSSEAPRESPCRRAALRPSTPIMCVALSTRLAKWKPFTKAGWWQFGEQVQQNLPDDWPNTTTVSRGRLQPSLEWRAPFSSPRCRCYFGCSAFPQTL